MISGHAKMSVEFKRLPEKHRRACQYDVLVEGITIGRLYKDYEAGIIGDSTFGFMMHKLGLQSESFAGHHAWYFKPVDSLDEFLSLSGNWEKLWFLPGEGLWIKQKQAFVAFEKAMDAPLKRANKYDLPRVTIFLKWLRLADSEQRRPQRFSKSSAL